MRTMTPQQKELLQDLIRLAGSSRRVERALRELTERKDEPPTLKELVDYIVEHRDEWSREEREEISPREA